MDLISVIVPVYKVEAYLDRCVQSILDQTYKNLEIILVDDGSPDKCPQMCDEWAKQDSRIRVIHKENGGGAQARNAGLGMVSGEYVAFVDSDDYLFPGMYEELLQVMKQTNSDIAECGYYLVESDVFPERQEIKGYQIYTPQEAMEAHIADRVFRQIIWNKLYKASIIQEIRFVEGKKIDDEFWTYRALGNADRLVLIYNKLYCYRQHAGSVMHRGYSMNNLVAIEARLDRQTYLEKYFPNQADKGKINLFFSCIYQGQMTLMHLGHEEREAAFAYLREISRKSKLTSAQKKTMKLTHQMWAGIAEVSLVTACRLRNLLRVGL